ncbi:MAG: TylF/MycF/NovP-related O-methyltransferase [Candidatus Kapaibacteriota bacterium]|jgi:O-methyltransferase
MGLIKNWLYSLGISKTNFRWLILKKVAFDWFLQPYINQKQRELIIKSGDPVRYGNLQLSIEQLKKENISGSIAECGVYKGKLSKYLHTMMPERKLFLFDTFAGFDQRDEESQGDNRFQDTSEQSVLNYIGNTKDVIVRKGYFPETAIGLENERFAFVMIDFDKYEPTVAALNLFYPLMSKGGFIFIHDYSSPESNWACSRALDEFLVDKPEKAILIPDAWGTALFRKI